MTILVTGATGNIGRHVVEQLMQAGVRVRALTRNQEEANLPDSVEVVPGDLARPETLPSAFKDVDRMHLFPVPATATEVVELAKKAGVLRVVVLSSASAPYEDTYQPGGQYYPLVERAVEAAGVEWTHVRQAGLMLSSLGWAESIRTEGVVRAPYGNARYPHVHEADVAEVATAALLEGGHVGKRYMLTGPESISQFEQVRTISEAIGRDIRFEELTRLSDPAAASFLQRFFKTGPGEYGESDLFRGICVPVLRRLAREHQSLMPLDAKRFGWSPEFPLWIRILGTLLIILALIILFGALKENTFAAPVVKMQKERGQKVISTGLYGIVRHPMYAGGTLLFTGGPLLLGSFYGLATRLLLTVILAVRSLGEEEMLRQELDGYIEYTKKVKWRLIPFVF